MKIFDLELIESNIISYQFKIQKLKNKISESKDFSGLNIKIILDKDVGIKLILKERNNFFFFNHQIEFKINLAQLSFTLKKIVIAVFKINKLNK
jgi:hypothetical protein